MLTFWPVGPNRTFLFELKRCRKGLPNAKCQFPNAIGINGNRLLGCPFTFLAAKSSNQNLLLKLRMKFLRQFSPWALILFLRTPSPGHILWSHWNVWAHRTARFCSSRKPHRLREFWLTTWYYVISCPSELWNMLNYQLLINRFAFQ